MNRIFKHILIKLPLLLLLVSVGQGLVAQDAAEDTTHNDMPFDVINLNTIVVSATRTEKTLKNTPVITQVITAKQIENRGFADIKNLLMQEVPGLSFQEVGFGTSINMQGLDAKHILFLIDGERMAGETGNNIDYSRLNLYDVDRIEIVKGAASAIYGSQAMGGVVNIITKNTKEKVEINVGGRWGERNQRNYPNPSKSSKQYKFQKNVDMPNLNGNVSLGINAGRLKSQTNVLYKSFDGYQLYDTDSLTKYYPQLDTTVVMTRTTTPSSISGYEDINVAQKLSYSLGKKFDISLRGNYYELDKFDFTQNNKYENNVDVSYGANLLYKMSGASEIMLSYYADNYKRYDKYELISGKDLLYKNKLMQPKLLFNTTAFNRQTVIAGLEYLQESLYGDKFASAMPETKEHWNATFFAQDDWNVVENLNIIVGIRVDYHEKFNWNASPKLSMLYRTFPFTLRLNYARGFRSPGLKELYMDWDHLGMFQIYGNENLKPETNNYVSMSGEYVSSRLYATLTAYGNRFRNKIEGIWSNNQTEYHYTNVGNTTLAGVEATARIKVAKSLFVNGTLNYLHSRNEEGVRLTTASPLSANVRLEYGITKKNYNVNFNFSGAYIGKKDYDVSDEIEVNGAIQDSYYQAHVAAYSLWNFAITQYFYDAFRITVGADNLFNYKASIVNFNTSTTPGRRFYIGMNLNIGGVSNIFKTKR